MQNKLSKIPTYSEELELSVSNPRDRFKWFLASLLFAKRISSEIAKKTYHRFEDEDLTTPEKILAAGWDRLVEVLDSGGYVRYDFSTASNLLSIMQELKEKYGDLEGLHRESSGSGDLEKRLQEFRGIGPVGVNIFLRELRGIWKKAKPKPSKMAIQIAQRLGLEDAESFESALVRINLEYCELPRAKALRLPASTTDSIPLTGYGGLISTGLNSLRPVGTHILYHQQTI